MSQGKRNPGWIEYRPVNHPEQPSCAVVLGTPRGGTTLIAHTLATLGVFMGEKLPFTAEDPFIARSLEAGDLDSFRSILGSRGLRHEHWGFKYPGLLRQADALQALPGNSRLVFIFRDFLATALRNQLATATDLFESIHANRDYQEAMLDLAERTSFPVLMISYEKALLRPEAFVTALARFLGVPAEPARLRRAAGRVQPTPDSYHIPTLSVGEAGTERWKSCLDRIEPTGISGWALDIESPEEAVQIEVILESGFTQVFTADRLRPDLVEQGIHPSGVCGFKFRWDPAAPLQPGDRVWLRFYPSGVSFEGGPFIASF